jgi:tetratricopeptide (TPR) repeat protein
MNPIEILMKIDISKLPYKHRFAAASMLMSKGNRLTELMSLHSNLTEERDVRRVLEGLSFYDMALSLMKPHDPNYQTLLHWKCLALISLGQFEDAKKWYEELLRIAAESEGSNFLSGYSKLAKEQIAVLAGKKNEPLPNIDRFDVELFDDLPFCAWAEQFCWLLRDRKFKQAHRYLSANLANTLTPSDLKKMWSSLVTSSGLDVDISLERFELGFPSGDKNQIGWCYFTIASDEINEAISMDVYITASNAFEIGSLDFGRP